MSIFSFFRSNKKNEPKSNDLDYRIINKKLEIERLIDKSVLDDRYCVYSFDVTKELLRKCEEYNSFEKYDLFCRMIETLDKKCNLSQELGIMINRLMNDQNYHLAIHRGYLGRINYIDGVAYNDDIGDIIHNGLIDYGTELQGVRNEYPALYQTCTLLKRFDDLYNLFYSYHNNNSIVFFMFPNDIVDDKLCVSQDDYFKIFHLSGEKKRINSEYIIGIGIKGEDGLKYYSKEELLKVSKKEYL